MEKSLSQETAFFEQNKAEYLKTYKNQFVLIKGRRLVGSFTTEAEAYKAGIDEFGNQPFLIKRVIDQEQAASVPALTIGVINAGLQ